MQSVIDWAGSDSPPAQSLASRHKSGWSGDFESMKTGMMVHTDGPSDHGIEAELALPEVIPSARMFDLGASATVSIPLQYQKGIQW